MTIEQLLVPMLGNKILIKCDIQNIWQPGIIISHGDGEYGTHEILQK